MHLFLIFCLTTTPASSEMLVKIDHLPFSEIENLQQGGIEVWEYNGEFSLVVCSKEKIPQGYSVQLIDESPRGNNYFVLHLLEPTDLEKYGEFIDMLWSNGSTAIVKDKGIRPVGVKIRAEIKRINNKPLIINKAKPPMPQLDRQNPLIEDLIAQIDSPMVYNYTKRLQDFRSRNNYNDSVVAAAAYVHDRFTNLGLDLVYYSESGGDPWGTPFLADNIVGVKYGETDSALILCGHLDATSGNPYGNEDFAPGADDNASGCAGVLSGAEAMMPYNFHRELRFVCFVGEELGLYGSQVYADSCAGAGSHIVGVYDMDMVVHNDQGGVEDLDADDNQHSPSTWLTDTLIHFGGLYVPQMPVIIRHLSGGSSDHASFQDAGYSAILTIDDAVMGANPYIHTEGDTIGPSANDFGFMTNAVKAIVATTAELAGILQTGIEESDFFHAAMFKMASIATGTFDLHVIMTGTHLVDIAFYDLAGERTATLYRGSTGAGVIKCRIPERLPNGVYFVYLKDVEDNTGEIKKIILMR